MPAARALDVVLSLLLDDGNREASRIEARDRVLTLLDEPFDPVEADLYKRERWGVDSTAQHAVAATEAAVTGQAGDLDVDLDALRAARG